MQLNNLVDFEKCCKMRIFLQNSVPITAENEQHFANILPIGRRVADRYPPAVRGRLASASGA